MAALVAGVDCSTQATKIVVCEAGNGAVVREARAAHPDATEVAPDVWWRAFEQAAADGLLDGVEAIAVAGQQHGMVTLDEAGAAVRDALLWNDTRSAGAATDLVAELGGAKAWADAVGSVPVASFTVTKLRWLAEHEPALAARVHSVLLPHDYVTWKLTGALSTDRGDASGTGYWSPATGEYRTDLLELAFGRTVELPGVAAPGAVVGAYREMLVAAGTGDNMGAALGLGAGPGDVVVSMGTSGTVFAVAEQPTADASGFVAGFADATGRYLPLVCTLNAARVRTTTARLLGVDLDGFDALAMGAEPGSGGLVLLPYLDGERTPDLPDATGQLNGLTRGNATRENLARAAIEGMLCGLADGLDALRAEGVPVGRVLLTGGAARSVVTREIAAGLFGVPIVVPEPAEYVAIGAARQAAWALSGAAEPPRWPVATGEPPTMEPTPDVRDQYALARDAYLR